MTMTRNAQSKTSGRKALDYLASEIRNERRNAAAADPRTTAIVESVLMFFERRLEVARLIEAAGKSS